MENVVGAMPEGTEKEHCFYGRKIFEIFLKFSLVKTLKKEVKETGVDRYD